MIPDVSESRAFVTGCEGPALSEAERAFFRDAAPWGLILFGRNCQDPAQVRELTRSFREAVGRADAPVLIDQEGGRVQRLRPPHWPALPPAASYGALLDHDREVGLSTARLAGQALGETLLGLGITMDCAPCCDLSFPETHAVIGDRAFARDPRQAAGLALAFAEGLLAGGVVPVVKHMPGHGRAKADSHLELPLVDADIDALASADFVPFELLRHMPVGMTAHVVYTAIDPATPGTLSRTVIADVIRGRIGFDGLLLSDDISMGALSGPVGERAVRAWEAGVDIVLHCNGVLAEMDEIAGCAPTLQGRSLERASAALASAHLRSPRPSSGDRLHSAATNQAELC